VFLDPARFTIIEVGRPSRRFPRGGVMEQWTGSRWQVGRRAGWQGPFTRMAPVGAGDVWAIGGGSFTAAGTYGMSPVQVLHWYGNSWKVELSLGGAAAVSAPGSPPYPPVTPT
jgi:hypothetical protein